MSQRDINKLRDAGLYAERLVELRLFEHGFNVAWPAVVDGTDLIAYDEGVTWQLQVKCCYGTQQRIDTRHRNTRKNENNPKKRGTPYKFIDAFVGVSLLTNRMHVIPTWLPVPGQISIKDLPETSPDVMRCPALHCLLDAHTCDTTCNQCRPHLQAMSATDREGLLALISRCLRVAKNCGKQKGRRGQ